jgi:hypothetical protein
MVFLAFFLTLLQTGALFISYAMEMKTLFSVVAIYGSPIYLFMNLLGSDSFILNTNWLLIGCFVFHLIKYGLFIRARMMAEGGALFWMGAVLEAVYLGISGYYLN